MSARKVYPDFFTQVLILFLFFFRLKDWTHFGILDWGIGGICYLRMERLCNQDFMTERSQERTWQSGKNFYLYHHCFLAEKIGFLSLREFSRYQALVYLQNFPVLCFIAFIISRITFRYRFVIFTLACPDHEQSWYLTISCRRRGNYKLIFTSRRGEYELVITEPAATNCFNINFQVSLSRKFCVYLHFTPLFTSWREHEFL